MNKEKVELQNQIIDFTQKAYEISKKCVVLCDSGNAAEVVKLIDEREKILSIIQSLQERLALYEKEDYDDEFNENLSEVIQSIIKKDDYIVSKLMDEQKNVQTEIAKVYQNKENLKGYNLNNLK
jgi:uncharacterized membrane protein YqiK